MKEHENKESISRRSMSAANAGKATANGTSLPSVDFASSVPLQAKSAVPEGVMGKMESSLNADFSSVNIHTESSQAKDVGALAYTQGNDVHFAPGQFKPETKSGQELIGHELTHVVQQRQGRVEPTGEVNGMPLNADKGLEKEADDMGKRAANA